MFTGLVEDVGVVESVSSGAMPMRLVVRPGSWGIGGVGTAGTYRAEAGDSVAVSGVCLTAVRGMRAADGVLEFDVVQQTLDVTTLGALRVGSRVNLEHAATASTLLGGHVVQGHVDGVATVRRVQEGADWRVWFELPEALKTYVVDKGSITIDGVSLTVAGVDAHGFSVALIPTTLEKTTLKMLKVGDRVNIEVDLVAKSVVHWLKHAAASGTLGGLLQGALGDRRLV
jgi:riboflavin synthase